MAIEPLTLALTLLAGLAIGALGAWLASRPAHARLQSELEKDRAVHAERLKAYHDAEARLRDAFQALSADALKTNNQAFLDLADTRLREARTEATSDIEARKKAIEELLAPMAKTLDQVDREIKDSERRRVESGAQLMQKIASLDTAGQGLRDETRRLTDALKRPGVRGRWGELQLKRVVELAGMIEYCDFMEQHTIQGTDDERIRPDVVVRLPGGKRIVIDAKAPLDAYLRALEAPDDAARQTLLGEHARQVRAHISQLSAKNYFEKVASTPEFVVMFLPGEVFFRAAMDADAELIEYGVSQKVIITSPTTLIALLKAVAYGWNQKNLAESARHISEAGKILYERLCTMTDHLESLGKRLGGAVQSYNEMISSMERRVLPVARKFPELDRALAAESLPELPQLEKTPRELQAQDWQEIENVALPFEEEEEKADRAKA
jgi:DNA recombination protein RmuC